MAGTDMLSIPGSTLVAYSKNGQDAWAFDVSRRRWLALWPHLFWHYRT